MLAKIWKSVFILNWGKYKTHENTFLACFFKQKSQNFNYKKYRNSKNLKPSLDLGSDPDPQPETEYISFVWKVGPAPEITEITEKYGNPYFFLITEFLGAEL